MRFNKSKTGKLAGVGENHVFAFISVNNTVENLLIYCGWY